jgi:membrane protein DedA with SNARE-associated domain
VLLLASLTGSVTDGLTSLVGDHGLYAVFGLMVIDAVLPAASELVMLYAGALAAGAFAGQHVVLFGARIDSTFWGFVAMSLAGVVGNTVGSVGGWAIGLYGGRPLLERRGRWLHLGPENLDRAERWFERYGDLAVFLGRVTPVVRSFVSIPAGVARMPLLRFTVLTALGCVPWCFGLAGAGWALGSSYERFHHDFRYVDIGVVVALVLLAVAWYVRRRRSSRLARRAADPAR